MDRNFRWEASTGELKMTQRNRQKNRETGRKVRVRGEEGKREKVSVCACMHANNISRLIK